MDANLLEKEIALKKETALRLGLVPLVLNIYFEVFAKINKNKIEQFFNINKKVDSEYSKIISDLKISYANSYKKLFSSIGGITIPAFKGKDKLVSFKINGVNYTICFYRITSDWLDRLLSKDLWSLQYVEIEVYDRVIFSDIKLYKQLNKRVFAMSYKDFSSLSHEPIDGTSRPTYIESDGRLLTIKDAQINAFTDGKWVEDFKKIQEAIDLKNQKEKRIADLKTENAKAISESEKIERLKRDFR